jgi:outer membrane protein TolC
MRRSTLADAISFDRIARRARLDRPFSTLHSSSLPSGEKGYEVRSVLPIALLFVASTAVAQTRVPAQISAPFLGGVPAGTATSDPLSLTIVDAINRGLQHNLGLLTAEDSLGRARGARWTALAELLPDVSGHLAETRQVINLEAFGFPLPEGIPPIVGPFNVFDARVRLSQSVFDLSAINGARAESHNLAAAQYSVKSARDLVVLVTANMYLQALAAAARADSAVAQMQSADALFQQASNMKANGLVAGIDVLRAEVQLGTERQRSTAAKNDFEKAKLQLARVIGLPVGQEITLTDELPFVPVPEMTLDQALAQAYSTRPDYLAALERVKAAESTRQAATGEYLPSVQFNADYGILGLSPSDSHSTYALTGALTVPIFNGGRTRAKVIEADATLRERRAEADDLKTSIYYDVKTAFLDLQATSEQLQVATRARELAAQQLTQARDRFAAGVANNIEIVQAQQAVAESSEQYIAALYGYNVSKALLARGLGVAEQAARQYLGGVR